MVEEKYERVAKLIMCTAENNNKYYSMYDHGDGTMHVEYGRIQLTSTRMDYPSSKWDYLYKSKTKKGYEDKTRLHEMAEVTPDVKDTKITRKQIANLKVRNLFAKLQAYANVVVKENYTVTSDAVTQAMIDEAQAIIDDINKLLKSKASLERLNEALLNLFKTIPRAMRNVKTHLFQDPSDYSNKDAWEDACAKIMTNEQDTLDTMAAEVLANDKKKKAALAASEKQSKTIELEQTILDELGLEIEEACDHDIKEIKKLLGDVSNRFVSAVKVINKETQKAFEKHRATFYKPGKGQPERNIEYFWHGSRNQNWYFILQKGLLIRPSGAVHTGSMFDDGCYFANKAQKSLGYSSVRGSYWANGNSESGYLAIFAVDMGHQKHIYRHDSSCYSLSKTITKEGYDSVYAHGGADLRNDEFIIYDVNKCTIQYLVELK